jgi:hypothetical protein
MAMQITVKQLRRLIMNEMKLGIAGSEGDRRNWGRPPELPDRNEFEPEAGGPTYIATDFPDFDPGEEVKAMYRGTGGRDMAGDPVSKSGVRSVGDIEDEYMDVNDDEVEFTSGVHSRPTRPATAVHEDLSVMRDPFKQVSINDVGSKAAGVLRGLKELGELLGGLEGGNPILKKGEGLLQHATDDVNGLVAILQIAQRKPRPKN